MADRRRLIVVFALLALGLAGASALSLATGPAEATWPIVVRLRLPRLLLGILAGTALGISGATLQGVLRNPLADPYILGTSTGGALATALALLLLPRSGPLGALLAPLLAFGGSFLTIWLVYSLARVGDRVPADTLLLSGVIVSAFFGAILMFLMTRAQREVHEILYILMGNLGTLLTRETALLLAAAALGVAIGGACVLARARELDLLALGEETALLLGVEAERSKRALFLAASLLTGSIVAVTGLIGFVGLVVPHLVRMALGARHTTLLPASALGGALLLVLADVGARSLFVQEIPVGVVTAFLGAPFFLYLLVRRRREWLR